MIMLIETRFKEPGEFVWEQRTGPNYSLREEISSEETVVGGWGAGLGGGGSGFTAEFGKVERKGRTHLSTFTVYSIPGMLEPAERVADKEDLGREGGGGEERQPRRTGQSIPLQPRAGK